MIVIGITLGEIPIKPTTGDKTFSNNRKKPIRSNNSSKTTNESTIKAIETYFLTSPIAQPTQEELVSVKCIALPVHAWVAVVNMLCAGLGNASGALLLSTARQGSCFIPILYPLSYLFGANGLAAVQAVADVLTLIPTIPIAIYMVKRIRAAQNGTLIIPEKQV